MNYLKYIELSAENLQFYLWFRDYTKRFNELPESEKALSPPWTGEESDSENPVSPASPNNISPEAAAAFKGTDFANEPQIAGGEKPNPFYTPPRTPNGESKRDESFDSYEESLTSGGGRVNHTQRASGAFQSAGLKWKPCEYSLYFPSSIRSAHCPQCLCSPTAKRLPASSPSISPITALVSSTSRPRNATTCFMLCRTPRTRLPSVMSSRLLSGLCVAKPTPTSSAGLFVTETAPASSSLVDSASVELLAGSSLPLLSPSAALAELGVYCPSSDFSLASLP